MTKFPLIAREADIQAGILEWLKLNRVFCWRNNTGSFAREYRTQDGTWKRTFFRAGFAGSADILGVLPGGRFLAIEVKRPRCGTLSLQQKDFLDAVNERGGLAFVAISLEDVEEQLRQAGYLLRVA
jgi:hypothetical protein